MNTPTVDTTTPAADTTPRPAVTADRWEEFLSLVIDTRELQRRYRSTMDPMLRREAERLEMQLDFRADILRRDLHAAAAEAAVAAAIAELPEGGVS